MNRARAGSLVNRPDNLPGPLAHRCIVRVVDTAYVSDRQPVLVPNLRIECHRVAGLGQVLADDP